MAIIGTLTTNLVANTASFTSGLAKAERALGSRAARMNRTLARTERQFQSLQKTASRALVGVATIEAGRRILSAADSFRVLQGRIRTATKATGDFAVVNKDLFRITLDTGTALEGNVGLFQRLSIGAREFGATSKDVLDVTEAVQQLGTIGGASVSAISAGTTQFSQAMAAGVVRAEEFNSIVENLPEVAVRIADGLGLTVGQLRKAVIDGNVLSKDVFEALLKQAPQIADEFADLPLSLERAGAAAGEALRKAIGETDQSLGATQALAATLQGAAENMDVLVESAIVLAGAIGTVLVARGFGPAIQSGVALSATLTTQALQFKANAAEQVKLTAASVTLARTQLVLAHENERLTGSYVAVNAAVARLAAAQAAHNAALAATSVRAAAAGVAMRGFAAASAFLGGPFGIAITAAAVGVGVLATRTTEAEAAAQLHERAVTALDAAISNLNGTTKTAADSARDLASADLEAAEARALRIQTAIEAFELEKRLGLGGPDVIELADSVFISSLKEGLINVRADIEETRAKLQELADTEKTTATATAELATAQGLLGKVTDSAARSVSELIDRLELENSQLLALRDAHLEGAEAVERVNRAIELQNALLRAGVTEGSEAAARIGELVTANQELESEIDALSSAENERATVFERSADRITFAQTAAAENFEAVWDRAFASALDGLERFIGGFASELGLGSGRIDLTGADLALGDLVTILDGGKPTGGLGFQPGGIADKIFGGNLFGSAGGIGFSPAASAFGSSAIFAAPSGGLAAGLGVAPVAGGITNAAVPAAATGFGSFLGPATAGVGAALGIAGAFGFDPIGSIIGGIFGDSDPGPPTSIAKGLPGALEGLADNGGDAAQAVGALNQVFQEASRIAETLGVELNVTADAFLLVNEEGKAIARLGDATGEFGSEAEATAFLLDELTERILKDVDPALKLLVDTLGDIEKAAEAFDFIKRVEGLPQTVEQVRELNKVLSPVQQQLLEVNTQFDAMVTEAERLQLTTGALAEEFRVLEQIEAARTAQIQFLTERTLDEATAAFALEEELVGVEGAILDVTSRLNAFIDDLQALGAAEEQLSQVRDQAAARIAQIQAQEVARIQGVINANLLAITGTQLEQEFARIDAFIEGLNQELEAAGVITAERALRLDPLEDELKAQARAAAQAAEATNSAVTALDSFSDSLKQFLDRQQLGDTSSLSAVDKLTQAQSVFDEQLLLARGGSDTALDRIIQDSQNLLDAQAAVTSVATVDFANFESFVRSQLESLGRVLDLPGFASGTDFAPGGLAIVGEQGPEIVNLPRGSQVLPADTTRRLREGGGNSAETRATLQAAEELIRRQARQNEELRDDFRDLVSLIRRKVAS